MNSQHDAYVMKRAENNADAPYDENTCRRYPHAAAARIAYLEAQIGKVASACGYDISKCIPKTPRQKAWDAIYSIPYEQWTVEGLIETIEKAGVEFVDKLP